MYTFGTSMYFQGTNMQSLRAKVCFFEGYCPNETLGHFLPFVWQCAMVACLAFCWYPVKVSYVNCINTEIEMPLTSPLYSYSLLPVFVMLSHPILTHMRGPTAFSTLTSDVSEGDVAVAPASSTVVTRLLRPPASSTTSRWTWRASPPAARDTGEGARYRRDRPLSNAACLLQPPRLRPHH